MTAVRRFPDYRSELCEQQSENGLALAMGPVPMLGVFISVGAGGAAMLFLGNFPLTFLAVVLFFHPSTPLRCSGGWPAKTVSTAGGAGGTHG